MDAAQTLGDMGRAPQKSLFVLYPISESTLPGGMSLVRKNPLLISLQGHLHIHNWSINVTLLGNADTLTADIPNATECKCANKCMNKSMCRLKIEQNHQNVFYNTPQCMDIYIQHDVSGQCLWINDI